MNREIIQQLLEELQKDMFVIYYQIDYLIDPKYYNAIQAELTEEGTILKHTGKI